MSNILREIGMLFDTKRKGNSINIIFIVFSLSIFSFQETLASDPNQELIGNYYQQGEYYKAIESWQDAIKINRSKGQNELLSRNLKNIAKAYLSLGQTLLAKKNIEEAIVIAREENIENILYTSFLISGNIKNIKGEYIEAEKDFIQSLQYTTKAEEEVAVWISLSKLFHVESRESQADNYLGKARLAAEKSVELSEGLESLIAVEAYLQMLKLGFPPNPHWDRAKEILGVGR